MRTFADNDLLADAERDRLGLPSRPARAGRAMNLEQLDGFSTPHCRAGNRAVNQDCTGTLTVQSARDLTLTSSSPNGKENHMMQTDSNTVLAKVSRRVWH
jgi:hypothetical protein